jgi:hypothetical protein
VVRVTDILLGLGTAVVKAACKVWLKDHSFAADTGAAMVDALQKKISGTREQRAARRLFEGLEDAVADQIQTTLRHEFHGLSDNERNAAVLAVCDTLDRARLIDQDIFAADLDPRFLEKRLREQRPFGTRDLSLSARSLYDRMLPECCSYVVEVARNLPAFQTGAAIEIMRRETQILDELKELLARMPAPTTVDPDENFATMYRRQVTNILGYVKIFGIDVGDYIRRYPLTPAYISLTARAVDHRARSRRLAGQQENVGWVGAVRIEDALVMGSRLFLRGIAGSGKTTLLQWLGVRSAQRDFPINLSAWNKTIPFFIPLRTYVGTALPAPGQFLKHVGRHVSDEMPRGWVQRQLRDGRGLVLIDGIDELPEADRGPAHDWLRSLVETFPKSRYVVTSRHGAVDEDWLTREGFSVADLEVMSWTNVQTFIDHWHTAIGAEVTDEAGRERLSTSQQRLTDALQTRHHLRALAINPLLCALLCALNLERRSQLPRDRMELYEAALEMLVERRDVERRIPTDGVRISRTEKTLILQNLAYWLIRNGQTDASYERVVGQVRLHLESLHRIERGPEEVLQNLLVRSGLIREAMVGRVDFIHRTFQEYLAAKAAIDADDLGVLLTNSHLDQWLEVVVMAAGHASLRQRNELLSGILERAEREPDKKEQLQIVAVACRDTSPELDPGLQRHIRQAAETLLPQTLGQSDVMAKLGVYALDLLADRVVNQPAEGATTIRAVAMIGGKEALPILSYCAKFESAAVRSELMAAWDRFDADQFAREVLAGSPNVVSLTLRRTAQIRAVRHIPSVRNLRYVALEGCGDLEFLRHLKELESLTVRGDAELDDLSPLVDHPRLTNLWIEGTGDVSVQPLTSLTSLRRLDLDCHHLRDIAPLGECEWLRSLTLRRARPAKHLENMVPPARLTELELSDCGQLYDLDALPEMSALQRLRLDECPVVNLAGAVRWARTLKTLEMTANQSLASLQSLPRLPYVETAILLSPVADLRPLLRMPALRSLTVRVGPEPVLAPLRSLQSLERLTVIGDADLAPLADLNPHFSIEVRQRLND